MIVMVFIAGVEMCLEDIGTKKRCMCIKKYNSRVKEIL